MARTLPVAWGDARGSLEEALRGLEAPSGPPELWKAAERALSATGAAATPAQLMAVVLKCVAMPPADEPSQNAQGLSVPPTTAPSPADRKQEPAEDEPYRSLRASTQGKASSSQQSHGLMHLRAALCRQAFHLAPAVELPGLSTVFERLASPGLTKMLLSMYAEEPGSMLLGDLQLLAALSASSIRVFDDATGILASRASATPTGWEAVQTTARQGHWRVHCWVALAAVRAIEHARCGTGRHSGTASLEDHLAASVQCLQYLLMGQEQPGDWVLRLLFAAIDRGQTCGCVAWRPTSISHPCPLADKHRSSWPCNSTGSRSAGSWWLAVLCGVIGQLKHQQEEGSLVADIAGQLHKCLSLLTERSAALDAGLMGSLLRTVCQTDSCEAQALQETSAQWIRKQILSGVDTSGRMLAATLAVHLDLLQDDICAALSATEIVRLLVTYGTPASGANGCRRESFPFQLQHNCHPPDCLGAVGRLIAEASQRVETGISALFPLLGQQHHSGKSLSAANPKTGTPPDPDWPKLVNISLELCPMCRADAPNSSDAEVHQPPGTAAAAICCCQSSLDTYLAVVLSCTDAKPEELEGPSVGAICAGVAQALLQAYFSRLFRRTSELVVQLLTAADIQPSQVLQTAQALKAPGSQTTPNIQCLHTAAAVLHSECSRLLGSVETPSNSRQRRRSRGGLTASTPSEVLDKDWGTICALAVNLCQSLKDTQQRHLQQTREINVFASLLREDNSTSLHVSTGLGNREHDSLMLARAVNQSRAVSMWSSVCVTLLRLALTPQLASAGCGGALRSAAAAAFDLLGRCLLNTDAQRAEVGGGANRQYAHFPGSGWLPMDEWEHRMHSGEAEQFGGMLPSPALLHASRALGTAVTQAERDETCAQVMRVVAPSAGRSSYLRFQLATGALPASAAVLQSISCWMSNLSSLTAGESERPDSVSADRAQDSSWAQLILRLLPLAGAEEKLHSCLAGKDSVIHKAAGRGVLPLSLAARWMQSSAFLTPPWGPGIFAPSSNVANLARNTAGAENAGAQAMMLTQLSHLTEVALKMMASVAVIPGACASVLIALGPALTEHQWGQLSMATDAMPPAWKYLLDGIAAYAWWATQKLGEVDAAPYLCQAVAPTVLGGLQAAHTRLSLLCSPLRGAHQRCHFQAFASCAAETLMLPCLQATSAILSNTRTANILRPHLHSSMELCSEIGVVAAHSLITAMTAAEESQPLIGSGHELSPAAGSCGLPEAARTAATAWLLCVAVLESVTSCSQEQVLEDQHALLSKPLTAATAHLLAQLQASKRKHGRNGAGGVVESISEVLKRSPIYRQEFFSACFSVHERLPQAGKRPAAADNSPAAGTPEQTAKSARMTLVQTKLRASSKSANPFVKAALEEGVGYSSASASEAGDDYADLEDFIVCNPDTDYKRFLESFRAQCRRGFAE